MKIITTFRNHLIIIIFAVTTVSPYPADGKSVKEMFAEVSSSIVVVLTLDAGGRKTGQGSGVVVGKNEVVTNCHVVSNARTIAVRQAADVRGRETYRMKAELVARNEQRDLCLLSVKELSVPPAAPPVAFAAARSVSIGEEVYAIGAPRGLDLSISRGIVSQLRGNYGKQPAPIIQTDAAISPGSSGGGLFNENGELLGITTFKFSGGASEGLSFALPVEWVKELMMHAGVKIAAGRERKRCFSSPTIACLLTQALEAVEVGANRCYRLHIDFGQDCHSPSQNRRQNRSKKNSGQSHATNRQRNFVIGRREHSRSTSRFIFIRDRQSTGRNRRHRRGHANRRNNR